MNSTLREINAQILDLTDELIDAEDETEETAILEALDALAVARDQKLDNIAYVRLQMKSDVKSLDAEIKRLQARKQATENAGKRLDGYVLVELQRTGKRKHEGKYASLSIAKSPVGCEVVNPQVIPAEFTVTETKILKSEAIRHYKNTGEIIDGMHFYQNEHVRIK